MTVRLAALGDSITVGLGDPVGGRWRGFASLLAGSAHADFRNFAQSGALTLDLLETQLPQALAWRPDIATVVIGVNDTLRGSFDIAKIRHRLYRVFGELTAAGVHVVTVCLPEPGRMLRLPQALARPLARRMAAVNDIIHSAEYPVSHAHIAADPIVYDRRMWSVDRLHPNESGHRYLAWLCHGALTEAGWALGTPPSLVAQNPPPTRRAQAWWMATQGTRWIVKRSTDLLPQLLALALAELRSAPSPEPLATRQASPT